VNWDAIADESTARALDLGWLDKALRPSSDCGVRALASWEPFARGNEAAASARASMVYDVATRTGDEELRVFAESLRVVPDVTSPAARSALGEALPDDVLLQVARFCDGAVRLADRLSDSALNEAADAGTIATPVIRALCASLERGRTSGGGFYLSDAFDPALRAARGDLQRTQRAVDALEAESRSRVAAALHRPAVETDEFIVMREAAPAAWPEGTAVIREAPAYFLCTLVAGDALQSARIARDRAADVVADAERSIRSELSDAIARAVPELQPASDAIGAFDALHAAIRFSRIYGCTAPELVADAGFALEGARFLPLEEALQERDLRFTPFDVEIRSVATITGPNMGGKTVVLRTCGAIAALASFGLPVPARHARLELFDRIVWLHAGDEAGPSLLSSFAHEVVRVRDVSSRSNGALMLLDEFARTTGPREGSALLASLLAFFLEHRVRTLATTHLDGVAASAGVEHLTVGGLRALPRETVGNLRDALALLERAMDYSVRKAGAGDAPAGDAVDLAELLGLDANVIEGARRRLE
jgi:DNA mismatch repair protein MutS2